MKPDPPDPDDDRKPVCPECGRCTIRRRTGRLGGGGSWYCEGCAARFTEPAYAVPSRAVDDRTHISDAGRAAIGWEPE